MCDSRKYPDPHHGGNWKFQRDGGSGAQEISEGMRVGQFSMGIIQSNLFNTDTKGTEPEPLYRGVRIIEVGNV